MPDTGLTLPPNIDSALQQPTGYSDQVTERVQQLGQLLCAALDHVGFRHDTDMNYNNGQSLTFHYSGMASEVEKQKVHLYFTFFISSKAPLFAIRCIDVNHCIESEKNSYYLPQSQLNERLHAAAHWLQQGKKILTQQGLQEVEENTWTRQPLAA